MAHEIRKNYKGLPCIFKTRFGSSSPIRKSAAGKGQDGSDRSKTGRRGVANRNGKSANDGQKVDERGSCKPESTHAARLDSERPLTLPLRMQPRKVNAGSEEAHRLLAKRTSRLPHRPR